MNKVEQEALKIIKTAIDNKDFIDWEKLFSFHTKYGVKCLIVISPKGISGKSTGSQNHIVTCLKKKDFNAAWIRNTDQEKKSSNLAASFTKAILDSPLDYERYVVRQDGIYEKIDPKNKQEKGVLRVIFASMNSPLNIGSQNSLKCDFIVYDEFINPMFSKPHLAYDFYNICKTLQRTKDALYVCLGNAHEADNDILNAFGVEFDWESGKSQALYRPEQNLLAIYVEAYKNKYMTKADDNTDKLFQYADEVRNFQLGKVANNNIWGVTNWHIHNVGKDFEPIFKYDCNDICYCVGKWKDKLYIKQLSLSEYDNVPRLCYKPVDKRAYNIYIPDIENFKTVKMLINAYSSGELVFSTTWARDEFIISILPYLKQLMDYEKKKILVDH